MRTSNMVQAAEPNNAEIMTEANIEKVSEWLDTLGWKNMVNVLHSLMCNMTSTVFYTTLNHITEKAHLPYYIWEQWFGDAENPKSLKFDGITMLWQLKKWTNQTGTPDLLPALLIEAAYFGGNHHLEAAGCTDEKGWPIKATRSRRSRKSDLPAGASA
jgi:hypothetical protein